ncbi:DSBA oxidoreductase, partial [Aureobasidium melanogenum]
MAPTLFEVKIYSDTICPWCYIGLKTLEEATSLYQHTCPNGSKDTFRITWSPYYLDPHAPIPGILASTRIAQKNGIERAEGIKMRLKRVGKAHGIEFTFSGKVGNTRDSHRLMYLAGLKGEEVQMALAKELLRIHFEGEADVSSHDDLIGAGVAVGLARNEVKEWLESGNGGAEVDGEAQRARDSGVNSVPTFEINGRRLEGAEDPAAFYEMFTSIKTADPYSREATIAAFYDYYKFLTKMFLPYDFVQKPPAEGWPSITKEKLQRLGKNNEVFELIRRLPYIPDEVMMFSYAPVAHWPSLLEQETFSQEDVEDIRIMTEGLDWPDIPSSAFGLTCGGRNSDQFILDTQFGIVYWLDTPDLKYNPIREPFLDREVLKMCTLENEHLWRSNTAWAISDFFEVLKNEFKILKAVPINRWIYDIEEWFDRDACDL